MDTSPLVILAKIAQALCSKYAKWTVLLISAFLLFAPEPFLEPLALAHFAEDYRPHIGLAFLTAICLAAILPAGSLLAQGVLYYARYARMQHLIHTASRHEKSRLAVFTRSGYSHRFLDTRDAITALLLDKGVLCITGNPAKHNPYNTIRLVSLSPLALRVLARHTNRKLPRLPRITR